MCKYQEFSKVSKSYANTITKEPSPLPLLDAIARTVLQPPVHRARETVVLLSAETPDFISPLDWPPNSSDLSPVDYAIWDILQERVYRGQICDVDHLKE